MSSVFLHIVKSYRSCFLYLFLKDVSTKLAFGGRDMDLYEFVPCHNFLGCGSIKLNQSGFNMELQRNPKQLSSVSF